MSRNESVTELFPAFAPGRASNLLPLTKLAGNALVWGGIKVRYYHKQCAANYVSMPSLKPQYPCGGLGTKLWGLVALLAASGRYGQASVQMPASHLPPQLCHDARILIEVTPIAAVLFSSRLDIKA